MADEEDDLPPTRMCGTMQVHRRLLNTDPEYARRLSRIEENAFRASMMGPVPRPGCTEIPVVVHIVHRTAAQNLSQAQIDSQIEVLNRDFRKTNSDISTVPPPFAPLAGDARITFKLATKDPNGNPTDGITRTSTNKNSFNADADDVKFSASGGIDAWPRDEYLNIWVCPRIVDNFGNSILGYAQFPGGPADTDGVVVLHSAFGTTGTAAAPFDKGRTTTHEIGHWLNLRHIWGDDGNGCSGSDFVADTPNQGGPNFGKPTFPTVSCSNGPNGDMFMNYMDYVDDDAMVMFSEGQITRMQACLDGPRSSIGTSVSCGGIAKPLPKDLPKDPPKDLPKDPPKDFPKDPPKDFPKDPPKDFPKDSPKDFIKDGPFDPGPKSIIGDGPGKGVLEPPKSVLEPPINPGGPGYPIPIQPGPGIPFVLGTGAPQSQPQDTRGQYLNYYVTILQQYADLHQRGMLDHQGYAAWQQAWASYQSLAGS